MLNETWDIKDLWEIKNFYYGWGNKNKKKVTVNDAIQTSNKGHEPNRMNQTESKKRVA